MKETGYGIGIRALLLGTLLLPIVGCAYKGSQRAALSPLVQWVPSRQIPTMLGLFPAAEVIVRDGQNLSSGRQQPERVKELVTWPGSLELAQVRVRCTLYYTPDDAARGYDQTREFFSGSTPREKDSGDTPGNRYCASRVVENTDDWWHVGMGSYSSWALFEKENLVLFVEERARDKEGRMKDATVREVARILGSL